jgi:Secretion system C-terminal sorting domain
VAQGLGVQWSRSYGSTWSDRGSFVSQRADGNYFIAGSMSGYSDADFSSATGLGGGLTMLVDSAGAMLWAKRIDGTFLDDIFDGCATQDGGYVLVGGAYIDTVSPNAWEWQRDAWVVRVDSSGNVLWQKHYGGLQDDIANSVSPTSDGGFYIAGGVFENGVNTPPTNGSMDAWVLRLDANGNELWQRCLGGSSGEITPKIHATTDGGAILSCSTYSSDGDITTVLKGMMDIWVVKLDSAGSVEWSNTYGSWSGDYDTGIMQTSDGHYLLLGYVATSGGDVSTSLGGSDAWVAKLDAAGFIIWERSFGGSEGDELMEVIEIAGGYLLSGYAMSSNGHVEVQYGDGDAWVVVLNTTGDLVWEQTYGGTSGDLSWCMQLVSDGLIMVGSSSSSDFLVPSHQGGGDVWLLKLSHATNLIGGTLYADLNEDGAQDAAEAGVGYRLVQLQNTNELALTDAEGLYEFAVAGMGAFTTEAPDITYYTKDPSVCTTVLDSIGEEDFTLDFRYEPQGDIADLEVLITALSPFRPGQPVMYDVLCRNIGTTPVDATLDLSVSLALSVDALTPPASAVNGNELHWDLGVIAPLGHTHILVDATMSPDSLLGAMVTTVAHIGPIVIDQDTSNNTAVSIGGTITSFDPNAIHVDRKTLFEVELDNVDLEYLIQFQNTGNDTAFYVRVDNILPINTRHTSFEFIGSSHPVQLEFDGRTGLMQFIFENILLPDSNANEVKSHGYVRYRLRPLASLNVGDTITNSVGIFFDLNDPVITEPALTIVVPEQSSWTVPEGEDLWFAPNPCNEVLTVRWNNTVVAGELVIRDLLGRDLVRSALTGLGASVNVEGLATGTYLVSVELDGTRHTGKVVVE